VLFHIAASVKQRNSCICAWRGPVILFEQVIIYLHQTPSKTIKKRNEKT